MTLSINHYLAYGEPEWNEIDLLSVNGLPRFMCPSTLHTVYEYLENFLCL